MTLCENEFDAPALLDASRISGFGRGNGRKKVRERRKENNAERKLECLECLEERLDFLTHNS